MMNTLPDVGAGLSRSAVLSADGRYRYRLTREWDRHRPPATFIMLNPSTADAAVDDPTIRRCLGYARAWGAGGLVVVNLYGYRSASPQSLWRVDDPVGPENDIHLTAALTAARRRRGQVIAAWGAHARADRIEAVMAMAGGGDVLQVLAVTQGGQPRHPLYLPSAAIPRPWSDKARC